MSRPSPPVRSASSRPLVFVAAGMAIVIVSASATASLLESERGDEDRPPIIISNNVITVDSQPDSEGERGAFERHGAWWWKHWLHQHENDPPVRFDVNVAGSSTCSASPYDADELTIVASILGQNRDIEVDIKPQHGAKFKDKGFTFQKQPSTQHKLTAGDVSSSLVSVTIRKQSQPDVTCTFDSNPRTVTLCQPQTPRTGAGPWTCPSKAPPPASPDPAASAGATVSQPDVTVPMGAPRSRSAAPHRTR